MFKTGAKINLYILTIPILLTVVSFSLYSLMLNIRCNSETLKQYVSPNNEWKVVLIKKDCGSLSPLEFEGAIFKFDEQPNHSDRSLFAFYLSDSTDQLINLNNLISIRWDNNSRISVNYDEKLDYLWKEYLMNGIKVQYNKKVHKQ